MKFFALKEWAAANADYNAAEPPYWHAKSVPDAFTALSGILWSTSYILMVIRSFKDKSYSMPIYCLCLNITWEAVYGFVYGPGLVNQIVFAQWMIFDLFLLYATVKFGRDQWRHSPLVAKNLSWILLSGIAFCTALQLSVAATFIPSVGRRVVFETAWLMQVIMGVSLITQIVSRGHTAGHSWGIWWTRMLGTNAAACCFYWRIHYWPERFGYAWTPYDAFLLLTSQFVDLLYPFAFIYVQKHEKALGYGSARSNGIVATDQKKQR